MFRSIRRYLRERAALRSQRAQGERDRKARAALEGLVISPGVTRDLSDRVNGKLSVRCYFHQESNSVVVDVTGLFSFGALSGLFIRTETKVAEFNALGTASIPGPGQSVVLTSRRPGSRPA